MRTFRYSNSTPSHDFRTKSRFGLNVKTASGFALIATISVMILLVMVALSVLSLSAIELRSSQSGQATEEARSNARMALMIAIGELQKQVGPDQRVTANAGIFDDPSTADNEVSNPHWTGVWDSWIAGDPTSAPVGDAYPSTASHHQTIGSPTDASMHPSYSEKNQHFRKWLLSLTTDESESISSPNSIKLADSSNPQKYYKPNGETDAIWLVAQGSLGELESASKYVSARLIPRRDKDTSRVLGRYGWWVGDESQKARILDDSYATETALTEAEKIFRTQVPASTGTNTVEGLEDINDDKQLKMAFSHATLNLVDNTVGQPAQNNFHDISVYSYGVLADVREGGLKRDLSTLLERPIDPLESSDDFMLYKFGNDNENRVPIQDLSAYYQLYQDDSTGVTGRRGGVAYNSPELSGALQIRVPDYGNPNDTDKYLREYTGLYRNPVPIKTQFVLATGASLITEEERTTINTTAENAGKPSQKLRADDIYKLSLGVMPVITLWNPNNLPLVMGTEASQIMKMSFPPFVVRWKKYRPGGNTYISNYLNLNYAIGFESTGDGRARSLEPYIIKLQFAKNDPIVFQPGEVKMFSIPLNDNIMLKNDGTVLIGNKNLYQAENGWDPYGFYTASNSAVPDAPDVVKFKDVANTYVGHRLVFGENDKIAIAAYPESGNSMSRAVSRANEIIGSGFQFWLSDADYVVNGFGHYRNYQFISKFGGNGKQSNLMLEENGELMLSGFPNGEVIPFDSETDAIPGTDIVAATTNGEVRGMMLFSMMAGCEASFYDAGIGGVGAARRTTTRPFLHGSTLSAPQIAEDSPSALYDYGWEWQLDRINDVELAIQDNGSGGGYFGGGYTSEAGSTHVVQQYLPVLPPMSIASLSSTHLGGYSLANNTVLLNPTAWGKPYAASGNTDHAFSGAPLIGDFQQVTATGQGGLAPHVQQAIGNSYAHPNIPADKAFTTRTRQLNADISANEQVIPYADHSYLANKALWDDYFFSSITPQFKNVELYGRGTDLSAQEVAHNFFFENTPLPNRRLRPYNFNLTEDELASLSSDAELALFSDGFADKIANYLLVAGPFNINSTSVEAWKVLFSSLRNKPIVHLDTNADSPTVTTSDETPVTPGMLPNGAPIPSNSLSSDHNAPLEQWSSSRSLSDEEIEQLAKAMVRQVKLRGPFLSLSEFINRRLDASSPELAVKGALQAAIDEDGSSNETPEVTINKAFRTDSRTLDGEFIKEINGSTVNLETEVEFANALKGPAAYGSTPYVDQADILRHLGSILTPRGDTFVIRAYGDSLDVNGNVLARAWCEAVLQRTPDYIDSSDNNHLKHQLLTSPTNQQFGRKFRIIQFRWLDSNEV
ncbi:hypothetical protein JO972_08815 [Verrucomicrobiaceae bacterium 5K15]|uniref:Uncharacterized protein n=1 Tax=Oceaniferula flava TaxID=2800421 RepID=A0AAE2V9G2_9BACT|nr:hypothetical protein [Oceaniferula flavus]MBK1855058.1 hypothetical protein [Oceaniferula flavus]MBM1136364.1 hypothetical protein [Oceaniferula flavus]